MRAAIITQIATIATFGSRVYQAFLAPDELATPFCTVKMVEETPAVENFLGSVKDVQVFIYTAPNDFVDIDELEIEVRNKLDHVDLTYDAGPPVAKLRTLYVQTLDDIYDPDRDLISKRVDFNYYLTRPGN